METLLPDFLNNPTDIRDLLVAVIAFLISLIKATCALALIALCEYVGCKMHSIKLKDAVDKIEKDPRAYASYSTGRFIGACIILAYCIG